MAQLLQPLFILLLLIFTLIYHPRGVSSLVYADYNSLVDYKNSLNKDILAAIWKSDYKNLVKNIDPGLLRSRKRGKRAGVRLKHSQRNGKIPLPAIVLTNGQSILKKLDELHGLLHTKRLQNYLN